MNHTNQTTWDGSIFGDAIVAITNAANSAYFKLRRQLVNEGSSPYRAEDEARAAVPHFWWLALHGKFKLHPAVDAALKMARPADWQQLLLEWPHQSETDPCRLAYTKDDRAGLADRQTITTVGKYLHRHWPALPDHVIRDLDARYNPRHDFRWANGSVKDIILGAELGPRSCMKSTYGSIPFCCHIDRPVLLAWVADKTQPEPNWDKHPYTVYDPSLGWGMATRWVGAVCEGRCLTWTDPDDASNKRFVRSYKLGDGGEEGYSHADPALEAWLVGQGYRKATSWPVGALFLAIDHPHKDGYMMPYLDATGDEGRRVSYYGRSGLVATDVLERDDDGDMLCDNTDATCSPQEEDEEYDEDYTYCEDCGAHVHYEDTTSVGRYGDSAVCPSCFEGYVEVRARHNGYQSEYYVLRSDATPVYGSWGNMTRGCESFYVSDDSRYWPEYGVVGTDAHGYEGVLDYGSAVRCTDGEYRFADDPEVVDLDEECPTTGESYALRDEAWQAHDGRWFSDNTDGVTYDGQLYPQDECWECAGTGLWYPDDEVEPVEDELGNTYHPDYFDRCSRSAEWGDDAMGDYRAYVLAEDAPIVPPTVEPVPPYTAALGEPVVLTQPTPATC